MITCGGREAGKSIFEIDFDQQGESSRGGFRERHGVLVHGGGEHVVQRIAHTDGARRELERTVRTADVLVRRLGVTRYPPELGRVIGYRPDDRAPFLVATRRGRPLAELAARLPLPPGELSAVADGVLTVLRHLNDLRLVHRDIRPATLWWDGTTVQLADFGLTLDEGDPRGGPAGTDPWRSPEQAAGRGRADCRDDVYAAGAVLFHLTTGEEVTTAAEMRDRVRWLDPGLRTLLDGVFTDEARHRVTGYTLQLRRDTRTGRSTAQGPGARRVPGMAEREQEARQHFRDLRARQYAFEQASRRAPYAAAGAPGPAVRTAWPPDPRRWRTVVVYAVLAVALIAVVAAVVAVA
ncbi:protein kinase domain-containing protein [Streptomyces monashensis]|uniref:protein kinase domain-containing protein n=1 Tax=Streptomyces monashensis TaxID=1678012 RepID=UPI0009A0E530|nr:protein kinase [Streptomyces monashensis]